MHISSDASIYLSFYEQAPDAIVELAKSLRFSKKRGVQRWMSNQVKIEFWKNRVGVIDASLQEFGDPVAS